MKGEKKKDNISVQDVHSKYVHTDAFDLVEHKSADLWLLLAIKRLD